MMIADAQIHLWTKGTPSAHHRQTPFLKDEALAAMDAAGQRAWKSPEFTVSLSPGRPGVVITDPEAIPGAFMRVRREPDKIAIGAAIASGADIPGAEMRNGLPALTIRTK